MLRNKPEVVMLLVSTRTISGGALVLILVVVLTLSVSRLCRVSDQIDKKAPSKERDRLKQWEKWLEIGARWVAYVGGCPIGYLLYPLVFGSVRRAFLMLGEALAVAISVAIIGWVRKVIHIGDGERRVSKFLRVAGICALGWILLWVAFELVGNKNLTSADVGELLKELRPDTK